MKTSESIAQIAAALAAAQGEMKNPDAHKIVQVQTRDGRNYSYRYAPLPDCFDINRAVLSKYGLSHFSATEETADGRQRIALRLSHKSGEWIESSLLLPPAGDPKSMAGNLTYFRRYLFNGLTGIAGDEDQDGEPASGPKPDKKPAQKPNAEASGASKAEGAFLAADPAEFVIPIGQKFKGKRLADCDIYELNSFAEWLREKDQVKPLSDDAHYTLQAIDAHLATRDIDRTPKK
jgi:hypothetical protein